MFALNCHELTEAALLSIRHQPLSLPPPQQLWEARSAPGPPTCRRKAEAGWHNRVWFIDSRTTENFAAHEKVVNVKPSFWGVSILFLLYSVFLPFLSFSTYFCARTGS